MQQLVHWLCLFQHLCGIAAALQFTHNQKAAFAIWCFYLTTEFQSGMLNLLAFFLPVVLNAEEEAASRELISSAYNFSISSRCFSSVQLKFDSV